jgi:hypothetical protein
METKKPLYWSTLRMYEECPQKCLWSRGSPGVDLGAGPGRRKPVQDLRSEHHLVMGCVIADVMERLYNDELYKDPTRLISRLRELVETFFESEMAKRHIDYGAWGCPDRDEMLRVCMDGTLGYIRTMKLNRILGTYAMAEVDLRTQIDKWNPVGGRADLIVTRPDSGTTIYDGKNSKYVGKYTDPDQLRWYALMYFLAYGKLPDRLAFIYFRYPAGTPPDEGVPPDSEWTGLVEVPFTRDDIKGIAQRGKDAGKSMWKGEWDPTPSPSVCKFCDYENVCEARQAQKASNRRKKKPAMLDGVDGVVQFGFGGVPETPPAVSPGVPQEDEG